MDLKVNPVGKPDAVAPHVRFDERGWETGPMSYRAHPRLYYKPENMQFVIDGIRVYFLTIILN